jgi:hypothetical protein
VKLGKINELADLDGSKAHSLALRLGRLKVLFIDEFSMVASEYLADCETRFRKHCVGGRNFDKSKLFGGLVSVIFVGDPSQLPPVFGSTICGSGGGRGQHGYQEALKDGVVVHLTEQMRQAGKDPLIPILERLKTGDSTEADAKVLSDHCGVDSPGFWDKYWHLGATHIFPDNEAVTFHNRDTGKSSTKPASRRCEFAKPGPALCWLVAYQRSFGSSVGRQ